MPMVIDMFQTIRGPISGARGEDYSIIWKLLPGVLWEKGAPDIVNPYTLQ